MKRILLFGTFDQFHPGHEALLRQAYERAEEVIVCLTQDTVINMLKGRYPVENYQEREKRLRDHTLVARVIPGDLQLGDFQAIQEANPDIIAIGYDQCALGRAINQWLTKNHLIIPVTVLKPYKPEIYKSSLRRSS